MGREVQGHSRRSEELAANEVDRHFYEGIRQISKGVSTMRLSVSTLLGVVGAMLLAGTAAAAGGASPNTVTPPPPGACGGDYSSTIYAGTNASYSACVIAYTNLEEFSQIQFDYASGYNQSVYGNETVDWTGGGAEAVGTQENQTWYYNGATSVSFGLPAGASVSWSQYTATVNEPQLMRSSLSETTNYWAPSTQPETASETYANLVKFQEQDSATVELAVNSYSVTDSITLYTN